MSWSQGQVQERSREALRLAEVRYQLAQTRLARLEAAVSLYKALGGGWQA